MKKYVLIFVILLACFAGLNCGAESKCDAGSLDFQTEHVYLKEGKTVIEGTFYNKGDIGTRVTKAELSVDANDMAGNLLRSASCVFSNVNAWVPAHGNKSWTFIITDSTAQEYSRKFKWNVKINYSYSNDNKPTVTPITSNAGKPAANSGQPQKTTDNLVTINRLDFDGEYEVVEVGKDHIFGDYWAEVLGATVKFFRMCDVFKGDKNYDEGIANIMAEENFFACGVIKSPSGSPHFTHKEYSRYDLDWLFYSRGYNDVYKYTTCDLFTWHEEDNTAHPAPNGDNGNGWGFSVEGDYLKVWRVSGFNPQRDVYYRGENVLVLKRIK